MTRSAAEVLPLSRAKLELEIPADVTEHDTLVLGYIDAAVAAIEQHTQLPIIQKRERYAACPRLDGSIYLATPFVRSITQLQWHDRTQRYADAPSMQMQLGSAACRIDADAENAIVWPPTALASWPELIPNGAIWLDVVRQTLTIPQAAIQAAVVAVRLLYDGMEFRSAGAFLNLLAVLGTRERGDNPIAILTDSIPYVPLVPETPSHATSYVRRVGWSAAPDPTATEWQNSATSSSNVLTIPSATINGYVWFAVPSNRTQPTDVHLDGNQFDQFGAFNRRSTTYNDGSITWTVYSTKAVQNAAIMGTGMRTLTLE